MDFIQQTCPNCGGELQVPKEKFEVFCLHCGTKFSIKIAQSSANNYIPQWEYQKFSYDFHECKYDLVIYSTNNPDRDDKAIATLKLWISNQHFVKEWFSKYASQGWELVDGLDSGCLQVYAEDRSFAGQLFEALFRTPYITWRIEGWTVNVRKRIG